MKAYTVAIGNFSIPITKDQKKVLSMIKECKGLIGLIPQAPNGTLILFDNINNAKECRNVLRAEDVQTGRNIVEVDFDKEQKLISNGKVVA